VERDSESLEPAPHLAGAAERQSVGWSDRRDLGQRTGGSVRTTATGEPIFHLGKHRW